MGNSTICMSIQVKHTKQPRPKKTKLDGLSWVRSMKSRKEWFCMNKLKICEYANFGCLYVPMHLLGVMWCRSLFLPQIFSTMVSSGYLFVNYFQTWQVKKNPLETNFEKKTLKSTPHSWPTPSILAQEVHMNPQIPTTCTSSSPTILDNHPIDIKLLNLLHFDFDVLKSPSSTNKILRLHQTNYRIILYLSTKKFSPLQVK